MRGFVNLCAIVSVFGRGPRSYEMRVAPDGTVSVLDDERAEYRTDHGLNETGLRNVRFLCGVKS